MAISIGRRVKKFASGLQEEQRDRLSDFVDLEKQERFATAGVVLGVASIVFNPLIAFALVAIFTR
jgi:hypothetical protein